MSQNEMKLFIGTKRVLAMAMSRGEYNDYRGWECSANEDPQDAGYLVEYLDGGESNHPNHEGYISWSPKAVFERANQAQPEIIEHSAEDVVTEDMIQEKGLTAPRVSLEDLHASIKSVEVIRYTSESGSILRFAILNMENGFTVTGRPSTSASPENDDDEVGVKVAIKNAVFELWPFLGFNIVQKRFDNAKND